MTLIKHCASWMRTKTDLLIVAGLIGGIIAIERSVGGALLAGTTPIVMLLACVLPCAIPLLLLRRRNRPTTTPATPMSEATACGCGNPACGTATTD